MNDQTVNDQTATTPTADTPNLAALLARWSEVAPEECEASAAGHVYYLNLTPDPLPGEWRGSAVEPEALYDSDLGVVLGAVVYHAVRRGLDLNLHAWADRHGFGVDPVWLKATCGPPNVGAMAKGTGHAADRDGSAALRALAVAALTAYLDATTAAASARTR